jgi:UDP-arabinose 4-epimerase
MRVLVVGGAGYIGSHVAHAVSTMPAVPIIYDNLSTGHEPVDKHFQFIKADLADGDTLRTSLENVDAVIHLAASCSVGESVSDPRGYFSNNVVNSLRLMNACLDCGVRFIIISSSCAAYGVPETSPISEKTVPAPINPYGLSKLIVDQMLHAYSIAYKLNYVALRYFNAAGANTEANLVEDHDPETHLIPSALHAVVGIRDFLEIYGDDYPTPDGTCIRDYIHVSDLAAAHVSALNYLMGGGNSCVINLGSGRGYSVMEIIKTIQNITGQEIPLAIRGRRPGDPPVLIADSSLAQSLLGWQAKRTLEEMVQSAWIMTNRVAKEQKITQNIGYRRS